MAPHGSVAAAKKSGWIKEQIFPKFLLHLVKNTRCTKEKPVLVLMDNHETHISLEAIDFAKGNGIILRTIPPNTSHKLQPLDKTIYGPFKKAYSLSMDAWMRSHPGRMVSFNEIPHFVKEAQSIAMTIPNITSGFEKTGIFPFNRNLFTDLEFAPSIVTDRPDPSSISPDVPKVQSHDKNSSEIILQEIPNHISSGDNPQANVKDDIINQNITSPIPSTSTCKNTSYVSPADIAYSHFQKQLHVKGPSRVVERKQHKDSHRHSCSQ
ncbi:uncharacterized protein [Macrobrachium rosenbergii]|uniref:uncharacterized protein n=1 Tax=Macrobrachium rosenbergii TaxID=79674 RepID=UPI0034D4C04E